MEDYKIVDLYWERNETAIKETDNKYGKMLQSLSFQLLSSREDAEECVNDTYLDAWNSMPEARPVYLGAFLSKITRRISIDRWRTKHREKRGGIANAMEELTAAAALLYTDPKDAKWTALRESLTPADILSEIASLPETDPLAQAILARVDAIQANLESAIGDVLR